MRDYVADRKLRQPTSTLLFVLAAGNNFNGAELSEEGFKAAWLDVYDPSLTSVPWFASMGNQDYSNADPTALCTDHVDAFECSFWNFHSAGCGEKPYSVRDQTYMSSALDANKGGAGGELRRHWRQPDFMFYYTIPDLDFEVVAMDWNADRLEALGGDGLCESCRAKAVLDACGSIEALQESAAKIKDASTYLLYHRAAVSERRNIAILSHTPTELHLHQENFRSMFTSMIPEERRNQSKVFNFYGHQGVQRCDVRSSSGECMEFRTRGGGGNVGEEDLVGGFAVVSWDANGSQVVECFAEEACSVPFATGGRMN